MTARKPSSRTSLPVPTDSGGWYVASQVVVRNRELVCRDADLRTLQDEREGLLDDFIRLADADDAAIADYATSHGLLLVCKHREPTLHLVQSGKGICDPLGFGTGHVRSPVAVWRRYAEVARATLLLADALRRGDVGDASNWRSLYKFSESQPFTLRRLAESDRRSLSADGTDWVGIGRSELALVIERWLAVGGVGIRFRWWQSEPDISLGITTFPAAGLFAAIAVQLMSTVSGQELAVCSHCGSPYVPPRKPRAGERNYCNKESCRKFGAQARASDTYRRKKERLARRRDARPRGGTHGEARKR